MPEVILQCPRVVPVVGELEAAGVSQHVAGWTVNGKSILKADPRQHFAQNRAGVSGAPRFAEEYETVIPAVCFALSAGANARSSGPDSGMLALSPALSAG